MVGEAHGVPVLQSDQPEVLGQDARHRRSEVNGGEVHASAAQAAFANMESVPEEPCQKPGVLLFWAQKVAKRFGGERLVLRVHLRLSVAYSLFCPLEREL